MALHRTRAWRRTRAAQQQHKQAMIYRSVTGSTTPTTHPYWDKQHALSCGRANCGFCRNPRFNRNSNGTARLTLAERRTNISYAEWHFSVLDETKGD